MSKSTEVHIPGTVAHVQLLLKQAEEELELLDTFEVDMELFRLKHLFWQGPPRTDGAGHGIGPAVLLENTFNILLESGRIMLLE